MNIKTTLKFVVMVAASYAALDFIQTKVMKIPVVGAYLPGGGDKPMA